MFLQNLAYKVNFNWEFSSKCVLRSDLHVLRCPHPSSRVLRSIFYWWAFPRVWSNFLSLSIWFFVLSLLVHTVAIGISLRARNRNAFKLEKNDWKYRKRVYEKPHMTLGLRSLSVFSAAKEKKWAVASQWCSEPKPFLLSLIFKPLTPPSLHYCVNRISDPSVLAFRHH